MGLRALDVLGGLGASLVAIVICTFLVVAASEADRAVGLDPYGEDAEAADLVSGLAIFAVVALYAAGHGVFAWFAAKRWGRPGLAIGALVMGGIGLLFLSFCGLLAYAFRTY